MTGSYEVTGSYERYEGGSPEAERLLFERLAHELMRVQLKNKDSGGAPDIVRTFHAKAVLGVENARLVIRDDVPRVLRTGFVHPGAEYPITVRLSNASGTRHSDFVPDLRGAALRVEADDGTHDLLMANFPVSPARNAREFVACATVLAGAESRFAQAFALLVKLPLVVGRTTARRMRRTLRAATRRQVSSLALETYWSRSAIMWGDAGPVRYLLRPVAGSRGAPLPPRNDLERGDPDYLHQELTKRLHEGDVTFDLCVQRYVDAERTPIEDCSVEWAEDVAPTVPLATVIIPRQDLDTALARSTARRIEQLAFNPWHTTDEFRPLGNLNRARKAAYQAASAQRLGYRFVTEQPLRNAILAVPLGAAFRLLNRFVPWHRLPLQLSLLNLVYLRRTLRSRNLIDTEIREAPPQVQPVEPQVTEQVRVARSYDGTYDDQSMPRMGAVGAAFGRNIEPDYRPDLFDIPNPVTVSKQLLYRERFIPARSLNILAAAWIQFQVHDWVEHKRYPVGSRSVEVPLPRGMSWQNTPSGADEPVMRFAENEGVDPGGGRPPIMFANTASHWWDGSEVYGGDKSAATLLREPDGSAKLRLEDGHLPLGSTGIPLTGFSDNWWLGLSALHTLFALEHNSVCDALRQEYPRMSEDRIYEIARLTVSALIAKIHTVEWTPAMLATRAIDVGLQMNWYGPPRNWLSRLGLWLVDAQALNGIPKTLPDHHTAPYSLTEDFITVYRMHPLIPDDYEIVDHRFGQRLDTLSFGDIQGTATEAVMRKIGLTDSLYSFGIAHPGVIALHNYPRALQNFERDGEVIDLSVVDIVRNRRRGVPRYNDFRAGLHKPRIRSFEQLTTNPESVRKLKEVYRSVDEVDTMVGLFAEHPPEGFGFSDTAFRVFLLMASRRLQSDRFLTVDFRPEVYTALGMDWIERNGMTSVILRHCPELTSFVPRGASAFAPWRPILPGQPLHQAPVRA